MIEFSWLNVGNSGRLFYVRRFSNMADSVVSIRPSIRLEQLGSHMKDFHEICYLRFVLQCVVKIQSSLKSHKRNGYLA
jgi:hypothetical protein